MKSIALGIVLAALIWDSTYRKVHLGENITELEGCIGATAVVGFILSLFFA